MHQVYSQVAKLLTIVSCFYGHVVRKTKIIPEQEKTVVINKYFYFTHLCLTATIILLVLSFFRAVHTSSIYKFLLPIIIMYELFIIMIFWSLFFISPTLIISKAGAQKENFSHLVNLCQHLFPIVGLSILFFETQMNHDYRRYGFISFFLAVYTQMMKYNKKHKGNFPYGFLDKMSDMQVTFIFYPCTFLLNACYFILLYHSMTKL